MDRELPRWGFTVLKDWEVARVFALREFGWGMRRIANELGMVRNAVRDWLRAGEDREFAWENRASFGERHRFWLSSRPCITQEIHICWAGYQQRGKICVGRWANFGVT